MRMTFLLLSYNQEAFVAKAVRAALAQEGEPISILISDDASTDRTFEIIEATVKDYAGPHLVTVNRNPKNLGLIGHINSLIPRIKTDYIIAAAGDDISLAHRARTLQDMFDRTDALLVHSGFEEIDRDDRIVDGRFPIKAAFLIRDTSARRAASRMGLYVGATGAWHRKLFSHYGDIAEGCYEDLILGFRAALEGRVAFVDQALVQYRIDTGMSVNDRGSTNYETWREKRLRSFVRAEAVLSQRLKDAAMSPHPEREKIASILRRVRSVNRLRIELYQNGTWRVLRDNMASPHLAFYVLVSEWIKTSKAKRKFGD